MARYYNEGKAEGGRRHIYGVPARDLTDEEYEALPDYLQAQVDASPLYRKTVPKGAAEATQPKDKDDKEA